MLTNEELSAWLDMYTYGARQPNFIRLTDERVAEIVRELLLLRNAPGTPDNFWFGRGVRAERSRCAGIAEKVASSLKCSDWDDNMDYDAGYRAACKAIAKAIRSGEGKEGD